MVFEVTIIEDASETYVLQNPANLCLTKFPQLSSSLILYRFLRYKELGFFRC
jgi:hypothetical protein